MLNSYRILLILMLSSFVLYPLQAQEETMLQFNLEEAQTYAIKHNLNVKSAKYEISNSEQVVKEYFGTGLPQISGNVNYQRAIKLPASLVPAEFFGGAEGEFAKLEFGTDNNLSIGLNLDQQLFSGTYFVGLQAANAVVELSRLQVTQSEADVKDQVTQAYIAAAATEENIAILKKNVSVIEKVLYETQQLYENGFVEAMDVDRLKLSKANLDTQIKNAERQQEMTYNLLKYQMGISLDKTIELTEGFYDLVEIAKGVDVFSANPNARIELKVVNQQNTLNELDIRNYKSRYLPRLDAFANWNTSFQANDFNLGNGDSWIPSSIVGVKMSVPIFDGFTKKAQIAQRLINRDKIATAVSLLQSSIELEQNQAKIEYFNALEQVENQKENLDLAERIHQTALIKYKEGLGSSLEVTSAEGDLYQTQGLYIQALFNLISAKAKLDKALGKYN
ncbi:MAG: TolC family protein [Chitinophagales bacterium]